MSKAEDENKIKIILLGESGVGKTNIINIAIGKPFNEKEGSTIASSFVEKKIKVDGAEYLLNLWDTIGQEQFRQLTKLFYSNSNIVIFVYDITNKKSFEELNYWLKDVENHLGNDFIKVIIGNKKDLFLKEEVKEEEGEEFAKNIGAKFLYFSAKNDNAKILEDFLIDSIKDYIVTYDKKNIGKIKIIEDRDFNNQGSSCCP